ncbi:heme ABC transporter ATP-binding protein [Labrys miyagiensis]
MTTTRPFVELRGIVKRFAGVLANDHVDMTVQPGEIHALLGENGAGKSTLMQILYGLYDADEGEIRVDGKPVAIREPGDAIRLGIGMVHQEFMLVRPMSVVENVVLGLKQGRGGLVDLAGAAEKLSAISRAHGLAVDPQARIEDIPIGVQQRVEILKLLYRDARLLILDEPTAVLTPLEKETLFGTLRSLRAEGRSIIIVTHKLHEIMAIADRVTVMRSGRVADTLAVGQTSERDLARRMVGRDVVLRVTRQPARPGPVVLDVDAISLRDGMGRPKLSDVSLEVRAGEILGIAGVEGNGQSELAETLLGLRAVGAGRIAVEGRDITDAAPAARRNAGIGFIPADRRGTGSLTALPIADNAILGDHGNYTAWGGMFLDRGAIAERARRIIGHFDVRTPGLSFEAGKLSGGNLQKLILGREVLREPRLLVVEQPTRGLDVGAVEAVWQALLQARDNGCAILMISAELEEIVNLSDRIAVLFEGRVAGILDAETATMERLSLLMAGSLAAQPPASLEPGMIEPGRLHA